MKKNSISIVIIALCVSLIGIMGTSCKPKVDKPCKSEAYQTNSDNLITGWEATKEENRYWIDFPKFFQDNAIEVGPDDKYVVSWLGSTPLGDLCGEGNVFAQESDCGQFVALPLCYYYDLKIGLEKNGAVEFFSDAVYDSSFGTGAGNINYISFISDLSGK